MMKLNLFTLSRTLIAEARAIGFRFPERIWYETGKTISHVELLGRGKANAPIVRRKIKPCWTSREIRVIDLVYRARTCIKVIGHKLDTQLINDFNVALEEAVSDES